MRKRGRLRGEKRDSAAGMNEEAACAKHRPLETVEKVALATFSSRKQSAARRIHPPQADESHTCGLRSVFSEAHVPGENGSHFFRACGRELCEAFSTR